jgi:hypothetical protein
MSIGTQDLSVDFATPDRRRNTRFPLREEVKYRVRHSKTLVTSGTGKTLNIGSGGILFSSDQKLALGKTLEISVNWPARLDGTCPLQFVATGKVIRSDHGKTAVRIERYEFKTRGSGSTA